MNYKEFLQQIEEAVQAKVGEEVKVIVAEVLKNNRHYVRGMSLLERGMNITPTIYMESYYAQYRSGKSIDLLAEHIVAQYNKSDKKGTVDFTFFTDFERMKSRIACKLVSYEKNERMLEQIPHRKFHDLVIVYYYKSDHAVLGKGSILIANDHLKMWGKSAEEIHDIAYYNTLKMLPYQLCDIADILEETLGVDAGRASAREFPMYVLTNTEKYWGAVTIIYDSVLEAVAEKLEQDFYVLPSSIHECMIVPARISVRKETLQKMVWDINRSCVAAEEILGDSVYRYSREKRQLELVCKG